MADENINISTAKKNLNDCLDNLNTQKLESLITTLEIYKGTWDTNSKKYFVDALKKIKKKYEKLKTDINVCFTELAVIETSYAAEKMAQISVEKTASKTVNNIEKKIKE